MDLIDRERALAIMRNQTTLHGMMNAVANMPSAERTGWIKFTLRPLDEYEREEYPEEWSGIFDCKLPEDGQEILVSNGRYVWMDTFFNGGSDGCYLDSDDELEDCWWMPLPELPKEG